MRASSTQGQTQGQGQGQELSVRLHLELQQSQRLQAEVLRELRGVEDALALYADFKLKARAGLLGQEDEERVFSQYALAKAVSG